MSEVENPLLFYRFDVPFDVIRAEHVEPAVVALLSRVRERLATIREQAAAGAAPSYVGTFGALDEATEELEHAMAIVGHLESVANTPALRDAYNAVQPLVSELYAGIPLDAGLYAALKAFAVTPAAAELGLAEKRFVTTTLDDFKRHGAELSPPDKERLAALSVELTKLTTQYSQNLLDATNAFELVITDKARLGGLPPSALEAAMESARARGIEGGFRFTLQQPSYVAVLTYADDAALREQLYRAYNGRATAEPRDNRVLIAQILKLRREKAKLLGFKDFADFTLDDRMAKNGARAQAFIAELRDATREHFARENEALSAFRREVEGPSAPPLKPWDISYYAEKLRKARYDFDEEELRPYFSVDGVMAGMFELVQRIYGLRIEQDDAAPRYHTDVRYYRVLGDDGSQLGAFYADLYPREEKRGGAWMADFITGRPGGRHGRHLGVMCANASPPVGGKPALLTHHDVETLFHEFGHLLHHLLGRARVRSLAGTRVAWDFVELPSMIMENWSWERDALDRFARHYETGAPIPNDVKDRMLRARTYRAANALMRQLGFSTVDLLLHTEYDEQKHGDVMSFARDTFARFSPTPLPKEYAMLASFSHLFGSAYGYAAGYYSYQWSEVLEADAFSRFKKTGILSREVGDAFKKTILSRGDTEDPAVLYRTFLGRDPDVSALIARLGCSALPK
jgi:oligopeptidase A